MKVVITTDCFLPRWDGVARFLSMIIPELTKKAQVTVFAPRFPGNLPIMSGVKIVRFPLINMQFGVIYFSNPDRDAMRDAIKKADVVFNQTVGPVGTAGIRIAKKLKKPIVSYIHSIEWVLSGRAVRHFNWLSEKIVQWHARRLYNKCSLLLVPSKSVADILSGNNIKTKKEVVTLGVPVSYFKPAKSKSAAKRKLGIPPNKRVIGFCGRIAREKDLPTLHEAFLRVNKKRRNTVLLIVGEGLEAEIPASKKVLRVGRQDNVVPFLQAMDIFVLSSLTETSSLATMEAMSVGLPVIATPVGSIPEYVYDKENGLLFSREDVDELVENLEFLLSNPKERIKLGKAARSTIVKEYSWKNSAKKIVEELVKLSG